ncbi:hypothetical protein, variant [Aphanomyces astaci]|nr:hypothetical protein, variant [Aphanomyces astaci]ETV84312.1 hypothetical protein, variant [Aphanomyces astaci]|eukprot:XP_009826004.1 hypothetical protein, variant [Aphanomyces astaci]
MVEFNTTRGHATLQVVWHLCHFQSTLLCLTQADSRGSLVSLCLCLTVCVVPLKLQAVRILHLVAVASPQGKVAVVKALRELDAVTHVVHVVADLMHETTPVTLLEEVFRFVSTLLLLHQDDEEPWLRQVLTDSETCATLVDFHACREDAAMVQLHAAECRSLMQKAPSMVYTLHQLMARAKHAKTEHVLLQIAQTLIDLTSGDPATWQHVVAHLTTGQGVPSSADAARSPPPSSTSTPPSPRPPTFRTTELTTVEDHPKYAKYFKMLQVRVPEDLVRQRMIADSVDDRILDSPHLVVTAFDFEKAPQPSLPPPTPPPLLPLPPTTTHDGSDVVPAPNPQAEEEEHHVHGHGILSDIHCTQVLSVLASLPWPLAHLGHVIQSGDESILTINFVDKLLVLLAIPSALEKKAIESILQGTHHSTCRDAERAVAVVLALAELIKCWQIYWQLPISLQEVRTKCTWMQDTCDEVIKSTDLFQVLQIGFALEESTPFEWRFLAMDEANCTSLTELAQAVRLQAPNLLCFGNSLPHLPNAVDVSHDDLHTILAAQQAKLDCVVAQLPTLSKHPWTTFVASAALELSNCKADLERAGDLVEDTVSQCFGGRSGAFPTSKLFTVLHRLSTTLANAAPTERSS